MGAALTSETWSNFILNGVGPLYGLRTAEIIGPTATPSTVETSFLQINGSDGGQTIPAYLTEFYSGNLTLQNTGAGNTSIIASGLNGGNPTTVFDGDGGIETGNGTVSVLSGFDGGAPPNNAHREVGVFTFSGSLVISVNFKVPYQNAPACGCNLNNAGVTVTYCTCSTTQVVGSVTCAVGTCNVSWWAEGA
jgi:hypothetical protein